MEMQQNTGTNTVTEEKSPFEDPKLPSPRRPFANDSNNSSQRGGTSGRSSGAGFNLPGRGTKNYFHSRRIDKTNEIPNPWTSKKDSRKKWHTLLPLIGVSLAFVSVLWNAGKDESRSSTKITAYCVKKTSRVDALTTMCGLKKFQLGFWVIITAFLRAIPADLSKATVNSKRQRTRTRMYSSRTGSYGSSPHCKTQTR